jgi:hypothetical protein
MTLLPLSVRLKERSALSVELACLGQTHPCRVYNCAPALDSDKNKNNNPCLASYMASNSAPGKRAKGHQSCKLYNSTSNCSYSYSYSYSYRLRSFTFYSLNWLFEAFYPNKTRKVIPDFINIYLTPLALAV